MKNLHNYLADLQQQCLLDSKTRRHVSRNEIKHVIFLPVNCQSSPAEIALPPSVPPAQVRVHLLQLSHCLENRCLWSAAGSGSLRTHWAAVKPWMQVSNRPKISCQSCRRKPFTAKFHHLQPTSWLLAGLVHCGCCSLVCWGNFSPQAAET